ncbi:Type II restriction endonuclease [Mycoplasmopsis californica]|uniref:Type II restriction endonuclease n=1 Tax=Mycoplasmopsis californica TaxID=2113 RepID=A0A059XVG1_9BACT|nr:Bsp6I family type II restriction endonuclease [Mycoplasmopsis californica]AIA29301.1 Type II restriction endonuclease [Mycoplasmopsis californica]
MKKITNHKYNEIISLYPIWKGLNNRIKQLYPRGINFHEVFSEFIVCYINEYYHSLGAGSEDAFANNRLRVQIKGTSNYDSDLTSFGPKSEFDILEFARLDQIKDYLYLYRIPIEDLCNVKVNKDLTFREQQQLGRRPRFSIISNFIEPYNLKPYAKVNLKTGKYTLL